jgi:hypothetical protein
VRTPARARCSVPARGTRLELDMTRSRLKWIESPDVPLRQWLSEEPRRFSFRERAMLCNCVARNRGRGRTSEKPRQIWDQEPIFHCACFVECVVRESEATVRSEWARSEELRWEPRDLPHNVDHDTPKRHGAVDRTNDGSRPPARIKQLLDGDIHLR